MYACITPSIKTNPISLWVVSGLIWGAIWCIVLKQYTCVRVGYTNQLCYTRGYHVMLIRVFFHSQIVISSCYLLAELFTSRIPSPTTSPSSEKEEEEQEGEGEGLEGDGKEEEEEPIRGSKSESATHSHMGGSGAISSADSKVFFLGCNN